MSWLGFALLSALFAGLTALLAKLGTENVPSNVATLVRTCVVVVFASAIVLARGEAGHLRHLSSRTMLFLVLSGCATGMSWLCYFAALKAGPISHVAPIDKLSFLIAVLLAVLFLHEKVERLSLVGMAFIAFGALLTLPTVQAQVRTWPGMRFLAGPPPPKVEATPPTAGQKAQE